MDLTTVGVIVSIFVSLSTLGITWVKFGREVHVDDKDRIVASLNDCNRRCNELEEKYKHAMRENERLAETVTRLSQRLMRVNGNRGDT